MKAIDYFIWTIIFFLGFGISGCISRGVNENRAVESGHAEYYIDENHEKQFKWLEHFDG